VQNFVMEAPLEDLQRAARVLRQLGQRDMTISPASAGGNLVATNLLSASFIDLLRNAMMVRAMGATVLNGLVGNVTIPRQTGGGTAQWVGEGAAPAEGGQVIGQVVLSPRTVAGFTDFSRLLALQSTPAIEQLVRNDLALILAIAIDLAVLHGVGGLQPLGIANTSGIGSVAGGTNGAAPTWDHIVDLETQVANANAALGRIGYLTNSKVRGKLKRTQKFSGTNGDPIWEVAGRADLPPGFGEMNGYSAGVSNNVSSTLTKGTASGICSAIFHGNWADVLIGEWGTLDLLIDPYTQSTSMNVRVVAHQTVDAALRRVESFSAMLDALTT
jgi:HK97 family phage major capsid protein